MHQCKKSSPSPRRGANSITCWLPAGLVALLLAATTAYAEMSIDPRLIYNVAAPQWLRAVGKLQVPGSEYSKGIHHHLQEDCSATLVARLPGVAADTIITAWHCLVNYRDLSRPIIFTLLPDAQGVPHRSEAYQLADGGGMHADWALLRLRQPVAPTRATALTLHPGRANQGQAIAMAGYSRDPGKGDSGKRLTFDPACMITSQGPATSASTCLAHRGASGGAVVQLSGTGAAQLSGVISEGDGAGMSTFVPVTIFRSAVNRHF